MTSGTRQRGVVAKWLNHRGIGFITPDGAEGGEGKDVLFHYSEIQQETKDGFKSAQQGAVAEYSLDQDSKNPDKMVAVKVTGPDGADLEPRQKGKGKGGKGGKGGSRKGRKGKGKGEDDEEEE